MRTFPGTPSSHPYFTDDYWKKPADSAINIIHRMYRLVSVPPDALSRHLHVKAGDAESPGLFRYNSAM